MNEPLYTGNITSNKPHDLTDAGVASLSIGCSVFHIIATTLLFGGIGGRYKKRSDNTHSLGDLTLIMTSLKGMIKQVRLTLSYILVSGREMKNRKFKLIITAEQQQKTTKTQFTFAGVLIEPLLQLFS